VEEVIVTANKRRESIQKVPMSITAVSGAAIRQQHITSAQDLSHTVPGFTVTAATFGTEVYTIRGVGFYDTDLAAVPAVSVYVDQAPIPFSVMTLGSSLDVERVEVLKGPQGTLFGENSTGGAINYIPAKPTDTLAAGITQTFGNYGTYNTDGYISGPLTSTLDGRLSFQSLNSDEGWQQSLSSDRRLGTVDTQEGRAILDWHPTDELKFLLNVNAASDTGDTQAARYEGYVLAVPSFAFAVPLIVNAKPAPRSDQYADWDTNTNFHKNNRGENISLRGDYELPNGMTLTDIASYNHYEYDQLQDLDGLPITNFNQRTVGKIANYYDELRLSGNLLPDLKFVVGGSGQYSDVSQTDYGYIDYYTTSLLAAYLGLPPFHHFNDLSDQRIQSYAGFANLDYDVNDRITVHAGGRVTDTDTTYGGCTTGDAGLNALSGATSPPGACVTLSPAGVSEHVDEGLRESNFSFRTGVDYKPAEDVLLYATISRGFKAGGFPVIASTYAIQDTPVHQEELTAYEVGFKSTVLDRTLRVNGALFYYDYRDKQIRGRILVPIFGAIEELINIPTSNVEGGELNVEWRPIGGLSLTGGISYIHSEIQDFSNYNASGMVISLDGASFPNAPAFQSFVSAQYNTAINDRIDAFAGVQYNYSSSTRGSIGFEPQLNLPSYNLVSAQAGISTSDGKWRLSFFVKNLTDTFYLTGANRSGETLISYAGMPRTYGVSLSYRFR